mgnify:CR=1 FL=1
MIDALIQLYVLIKRFEGCRLMPYLCPSGVLTCGWGSTGVGVFPGVPWTQEYADERMYADALRFARGVLVLCPMLAGNNNHWCAVADLGYNIGLGNFQASTIRRMLNAGDINGAAAQFGRWIYGSGGVLPGLVTRRAAERDLFLR